MDTMDDRALIELIYDAVFDDAALVGILKAINARNPGGFSTLTYTDPAGRSVHVPAFAGIDGPAVAAYRKTHFFHDPLRASIPHFPLDRAFTCTAFVPRSAHLESRFYAEFMRPLGDLRTRVLIALRTAGSNLGIISAAIPGAESEGVTARMMETLALVRPHLARALRLREGRSRDAAAAKADLIHSIGAPALLATSSGTLLASNRAAEALSRRAGARPGDPSSGANPLAVGGSDRLGQAVRAFLAGAGPAARVVLPFGPSGLMFAQLVRAGTIAGEADGAWGTAGEACALILLKVNGEADPDQLAATAAFFGLSGAEARLVTHLSGGTTLSDAALALGLSRNTVRNQLASVMDKTGLRRQSDVVRIFAF